MALKEQSVTCGVCSGNTHQFLPSPVSETAPPDFDTRPQGSAVETWIAQCPHCGYCAEDLTSAQTGTREFIDSPVYRERLADSRLPATARHFTCYALLVEKAHYWADAGWIWLHAAWACDDSGDKDAATLCRACALDRWKRGKELGQTFADDLASEYAIVTDLYRRIGQFENATVTCAEGLDLEDVPASIEQMLRRQMTLIQFRDTDRHSMTELRNPAE
jgi:hypothetical protein